MDKVSDVATFATRTNAQVTVLSYDLCVRMAAKVTQAMFNVVIADESHAIKNMQTKRTKMMIPLFKVGLRLESPLSTCLPPLAAVRALPSSPLLPDDYEHVSWDPSRQRGA